jgi:small-conductance mechanosensitive channel
LLAGQSAPTLRRTHGTPGTKKRERKSSRVMESMRSTSESCMGPLYVVAHSGERGRPVIEIFTPPVAWPIAVGTALALVAALEILYRVLFGWLGGLVEKTATRLDDVLVRRMRIPAQVLVFLAGAHVLFFLRDIENAVLSKAVTITELLLVAYLLIEALETALIDFWLGKKKKVQIPSVVRGLALIVLYTVAALSIVGSVTGINLAPILATSTVLTVVLGLALQDTLGNLFAGLAMQLEKPFEIGDWILVDGLEGKVTAIGWRAVHLQTFSWDAVVIPNSVIAKARVQSFKRPTARNIEFVCTVDAPPDDVEKCVRAACARVSEVRADPEARVWLLQQTPLAQRWVVKVWLEDYAQHDESESRVLRAVVTELQQRGVGVKPSLVASAS